METKYASLMQEHEQIKQALIEDLLQLQNKMNGDIDQLQHRWIHMLERLEVWKEKLKLKGLSEKEIWGLMLFATAAGLLIAFRFTRSRRLQTQLERLTKLSFSPGRSLPLTSRASLSTPQKLVLFVALRSLIKMVQATQPAFYRQLSTLEGVLLRFIF